MTSPKLASPPEQPHPVRRLMLAGDHNSVSMGSRCRTGLSTIASWWTATRKIKDSTVRIVLRDCATLVAASETKKSSSRGTVHSNRRH